MHLCLVFVVFFVSFCLSVCVFLYKLRINVFVYYILYSGVYVRNKHLVSIA